jgi:poly(A) polymerase
LSEDACRRDFTINSLYLDPVAKQVIDYQGGVDDLQNRRLKLIGDPDTRFAEDPVRMLRALRFKAKLGFAIPDDLEALIEKHHDHFRDVSNARLFDETFKLFHHAHAVESWHTLCEHGFLPMLFPLTENEIERDEIVEDFILRALENTDRRVAQGKPVIPAFFFAVILWHAYLAERNKNPDLSSGREGVYRAAENVFRAQYPVIAIPKRVSSVIIEIWDMQWHLEMRRVKSIDGLLENRRFRAAYDFLLLRQKIGEIDSEIPDWWTRIQDEDDSGKREMVQALPRPKTQRRGRGPRRKKVN